MYTRLLASNADCEFSPRKYRDMGPSVMGYPSTQQRRLRVIFESHSQARAGEFAPGRRMKEERVLDDRRGVRHSRCLGASSVRRTGGPGGLPRLRHGSLALVGDAPKRPVTSRRIPDHEDGSRVLVLEYGRICSRDVFTLSEVSEGQIRVEQTGRQFSRFPCRRTFAQAAEPGRRRALWQRTVWRHSCERGNVPPSTIPECPERESSATRA